MRTSDSVISETTVCSVFAIILFVLLTSPAPVESQRPAFGRCPDLTTVDNFNMTEFQGVWYEVERSFYFFEITSTCTTFNFTSKPDKNLRIVIKTINRLSRNPSVHLGTAMPHFSNPAKLSYRVDSYLPPALSRMLPGAGEYSILDTDYTSFALLYSCSDLGFLHADLIWVLGRERDFPADLRHKVYTSIQDLGFDPDILVLTNNKNCPPPF